MRAGLPPSKTLIRVLVAEDNFFTRLGTVALLREQPDMDVVGAVPDGRRALALFEELHPDVLVLDLRMPEVDGVSVAASLHGRDPAANVLVLTSYCGDEDIFQALTAGARGYLTKESSGEDLLMAIRTLHAGRRFVPPAIAALMSSRRNMPQLTPRERQVLEAVADGASNREVGETLRITERTAGLFVSSILNKLGARSRTEAVSIALRRGLLRPSQP
jgi:DNA-binding NarL/FixJ family response regulator